MKKLINVLLNILLCLTCFIIIILSLAFVFIEGRLLISLDWSIYDFAFNGFIRYFFRLLIALFALTVSIFEIINLFKKNQVLTFYLKVCDIALVLIAILVLIFTTNYIGLVCIILSSLLFISKLRVVITK